MQIQTFNVGMLSTNCYVASCLETGEAIIIDPGFDDAYETAKVIRYLDNNAFKVKFIVNTHGHADYISGDMVLKRKFCVPICIHINDMPCLSVFGNSGFPVDIPLQDEGSLRFGEVVLKVMHTPGHTIGSISIVGEKTVFTGDTLFAGGIGRTDYAGGSDRDMRRSLQKLLCLPGDYAVYPGHGFNSTIGKEKSVNPFLRWL